MSLGLATPGTVATGGGWRGAGAGVASGWGRGGAAPGFLLERPKESGGAVFFRTGCATGFGGVTGATGGGTAGVACFFGAAGGAAGIVSGAAACGSGVKWMLSGLVITGAGG